MYRYIPIITTKIAFVNTQILQQQLDKSENCPVNVARWRFYLLSYASKQQKTLSLGQCCGRSKWTRARSVATPLSAFAKQNASSPTPTLYLRCNGGGLNKLTVLAFSPTTNGYAIDFFLCFVNLAYKQV